MAKAAAAKAALNDLGKAAAAEAATETAGSTAAAAAHKADSAAIKQEIADLAALSAAAKAANVQTAFGGRSTMDQHLADMQREVQYTDLLNRAHWLNFTSPQQAYAWQQQQLNQKRLMNYADWANYTSPDQYLNYLQRQRAELTSLNSVMVDRAQTYRALTSAALDYTNALQGTSKTLGQLGESGGSVQAIEAALTGLPSQVTTTMKIDDTQAVAALAAYRAMLEGTPRLVSTTEIVEAGKALGAVPLVSPISLAPTVGAAPAGLEAAMQRGIMDAFAQQLARMSALRANVPQLGAVSTVQEAAQVAAFMAAIRDRLPVGRVSSLLAGGTVPGSGAPPPGALYTSPSEAVIDKWAQAGAVLLQAAQEEKQTADAQSGGLDRLLALEDAFLASRGAAGAGGGGGGTIPPVAGGAAEEPPNPNDKAAWEALAGALHDTSEGFSSADREASDLGDTLEGTVITTVQDAIDHVESLGVTSAKSAGQLGYILQVLRSMSQEKISDLGMGNVQSLLDMITKTGDVGSAAKVAYAAFQEYKRGLADAEEESDRASTGALLKLAGSFYKARASADAAAQAAAAAGGGFAGWGSKFTLWGGAFGNTMAGMVAGWHLWIDGIIEFLAVAVPALGALVIGLGAFGIVAYQTGNTVLRMIDVMSHLGIVTDATGKAVAPFHDAWQRLQSVIQPEAWQLVGDAITVMNHNTGVFATIAEKTGSILDELAAKITDKLVSGSGKGLLDFFNIGIHDLQLFASLFSGLGSIILTFIKATQETQIAEKLLTALGFAAHLVADALGSIPAPLLAVAIGLHGFLIYGGLFTTWLQRAALGIDGLVAKIPGMSGFALSFAQKIGASSEQLNNLAASSGKLDGLAKSLGVTAYQAGQLEAYVKSTGMSMEEFARSTTTGSDMVDKYSQGLSDAGKASVAAGIAMGGTDEQIAKIAKDAESAGSETGFFSKTMSGLSGFLASNWLAVAAAAAAAFAYIAVKALSATSGTTTFVNGLRTGLQNMNAAQAFVSIPDNLGKIEQQIQATNKAWTNEVGFFGSKGALNSWSAFAARWRQGFDEAFHGLFGGTANPDLQSLNNELNSELKTYGNLSQTINGLTKQGYSFTQSLGVINAAGVNVNDSLQVMQTKVQGLLSGYEFAGQRIGIVGNDMNALSVTSSQTVTQMGKLNQAWDSWTQTVSGPISSFLTLNQGMAQFANDAKAAGASMSGLGTIITTTQTTTSNTAVVLQQDFQSLYGDVETVFDSIRMAEATYANAGGTGNQFVQSVKDGVAALIPLAGTNKAAAAEVSALAQEAGGPATTNLKQLAIWAGNVKDPMTQLQKLTNSAAIAASNLSQDASQLTTTISQELIPQMAASIIAASKSGPAMQNFASAVLAGQYSIQSLAPSATTLWNTLLKVSGNASNAKALFVGFAESMHMSSKQANELWTYIQQHEIKPKVDTTTAHNDLSRFRAYSQSVYQPPSPSGWDKYWSYIASQWSQYVWHPIYHFFGQEMPGWLMENENQFYKLFDSVGNMWDNWVNKPGGKFFDQLLPGWIDEGQTDFIRLYLTIASAWSNYVAGPVMRFFTSTVPGWLSDAQGFFARVYVTIGNFFTSDVEDPMRNLFTHDIPSWWDSLGGDWRNLWSGAWSDFEHVVIAPMSAFLTKTVPGWIGNIGGFFNRAWNTAWSDFSADIWKPVQNFFTKTVPGWLGLAGGGDPGTFSGSVPGSSEGDNYRAVVMGGEYVLRQPARMALEAQFGRGFMDWLNQYDTIGGGGSRGILASQRGSGSGRYAGGGGILGDISSFLNGASSDLGHLSGSAMTGLENLMSEGSQAVFNTMWNGSAGALLNDLPHTLGGDIAHWLGDEAKSGIDKMLGTVDSKSGLGGSLGAMIGAGARMAGSGQVRQEQMYALSLFPRFGWNSSQLPPLIDTWNRESGWNPDAVNPGSGAYGIPQALGKGHPYALGDWVAQILWGEQYIKGRYGTPAAAWAHEESAGWYAGGGPVVTAIINETGNKNIRQAMLLGSWLESRWNPKDYGQHSTAFGPYMIEPRKHKGVTKTEAQDPVWSTRFMYPYYKKAADSIPERFWSKLPENVANQAAGFAEVLAGSPFVAPGRGDLAAGWRAVTDVLGSGVEPPTSPGKGGDAVQEYNYWAAKIGPAWNAAYGNWNNLSRRARPKHISNADWEPWVADTLAIWQAEERVRNAWDNSGTPAGGRLANFTNAQWETLRTDMDYWHGLLHGNTPPKSAWGTEHAIKWPKGFKAGDIRPSLAAARVRFPEALSNAYGSVGTLQNDITQAFYAWQKAWGDKTTKGGGTPGITVRNPGDGNVSTPVNLGPLIYGSGGGKGPTGPGGYGFAGGGPIDVAALFASGGVVPAPSFIMPGVSMTLQKQLAGAASSSLPRTMGDAAGTSVGMQVGELTINNPAAEKPSESIARASNRLAFMAGRGPF